MQNFLGVECSATNRKWVGPNAEQDRHAQALAQQTGLPIALCQLLAQRGVNAEAVTAFLTPSLRELMPDPSSLKDMDIAADRLATAVRDGEKVAIFADYDVDGGSSAALLMNWFSRVGMQATLYVPDRISEGYGPNEAAMRELAKHHNLIICVDCGTLSFEPIAAAHLAEVIVLDHHQGGETLPAALAVVNPNRQDESAGLEYLCAAGVVFMLLVATNRLMRKAGATPPDLMELLDLVALATVADVAPLVGLNRAFVRQGLSIMARRQRVGLTALCDIAKLDAAPNTYHLGFLLGPRINAGGRIGKADLGARLLSTDDRHVAGALAEKLDQLNRERREVEEQVRLKALDQAQARGLSAPLVWAADEGWHPGVVGIVAARLKELANRPAVVIGFDEGGGKGSGRSVTGVDLGASITTLAAEGLIEKGGGHKMAAGLSLTRAQLEPAMARLTELLADQGSAEIGPAELFITSLLSPKAITIELIETLESAGPFGAGAPAPRFALPSVRVAFAKRAGENHLRLAFEDADGARIDAIAFRAFDGPLGDLLQNHAGAIFNVVGRLEIDSWGGRKKPKLRLEDASLIGEAN
ncbi:MAG: single-stranded-DNA-specific exonuclease RecJ [Alphaproteobacteria bacterium]|nr:single-stranded-DNA-specific exonuclease RecJ [Alphaproteobacteria bacterium]